MKIIKETRSPVGRDPIYQWYSPARDRFIVGSSTHFYALSLDDPADQECLVDDPDSKPVIRKLYNCYIPDELYEEYRSIGLNGFAFLGRDEYDGLTRFKSMCWPGPMDVVHQSGMVAELPLRHAATNSIVVHQGSKVQIADLKGGKYKKRCDVKLRNTTQHLFAHPSQPCLFYGCDSTKRKSSGARLGELRSITYNSKKSKQAKVAELDDDLYDVQFSSDESVLFACGRGFVTALRWNGKTYEKLVTDQAAAKQMILVDDETLVINGGLNGLRHYSFRDDALKLEGTCKLENPVARIALHPGTRTVLASTDAEESTLATIALDGE